MDRKKFIYVCSPLKGDIEGNIKKAISYSRFVYEQGGIPLAPHTIFTQFLDDRIEEERSAGIDMGLQLLFKCDELWTFGDRISLGMAAEVAVAKTFDIVVRRFDEVCEEVCNEQSKQEEKRII